VGSRYGKVYNLRWTQAVAKVPGCSSAGLLLLADIIVCGSVRFSLFVNSINTRQSIDSLTRFTTGQKYKG
jgi:hypothetical protein